MGTPDLRSGLSKMAITISPTTSPSALPLESSSPTASTPTTVVTFGSSDTLPQIKALTDISTITRLLHECIAHQRSLDTSLTSHLSQRPDLDRHVTSLHLSSTHLLSHLNSSSDHLRQSISSTSALADHVSSKVRELDCAQSNVHLTLSRLDDIVDLNRFADAAKSMLEAENYESCAEAIRSFLNIDRKYQKDSDSESRLQLLETKNKLEGIVRRKLTESVDKRDHESILRYVKIFAPLGLEEEGLQIYVHYIRKVVGMRSRLEFEHLVEVLEMEQKGYPAQEKPDFLGCLTNLFKDVVLAVEENDEVLSSLCGEDGIVYAICELQEECDSRGTLLLKRYMEYRGLAKIASNINSYSKNLITVGVGGVSSDGGPDPREIEFYMEEILLLTQLGEDYTEFMISKIRSLGSVEPNIGPQATKAFRNGSFNRAVQDITGFYVIFEEFFMVENVRKAISIDEQVPDSLTTSMVDDVFYVLQSCCRRAISTGNSNSVLAVLSGAVNLLANEYQEALQQKMREPNLGAKLFLGGTGVQKTGTDIATALNNMDVSSEYVLKLKHEIEEQCIEVFPAAVDREKVKSCLSELGEMSNTFKQVLNAGMEQLVTTITPRIRPVLDSVGTISYELSESEYEEYEVNDPWVQKVLHAVETNIAWLQPTMTTNNYDSLVHLVIDFIVKRLEVIMMQKRFSPLGSLQLDRDTRALVNHFYGMTQRPVRDKFARLTQMTTILNVEKVSEILDFWGENSGTMTWRLTPAEVRRVLGLRVDFKSEAIAALKL